jgi:hypothetical protein
MKTIKVQYDIVETIYTTMEVSDEEYEKFDTDREHAIKVFEEYEEKLSYTKNYLEETLNMSTKNMGVCC